MSTALLCRHEMSADTCALCNGAEKRSAPRVTGGWIRAQYPGVCAGCGKPFDVGDVIHHSDLDSGWVRNECCA